MADAVLDGATVPEPESTLSNQPRLLTPAFVTVVVTQMAFGYGVSTFLLLPKFLATQLNGSASEIGRVGAIPGLTAALIVPFVGSALDRFGRRPLIRIGAALGVVCALAWLGVREIGWLAHVLQVMCGFAFMLAFSGSSTLIADAAPPAKLGQAIGLFGAANITMNALAPAVAEKLAHDLGWVAAFGVAATAFGTSFALSFRVREPARDSTSAAVGGQVAQTLGMARRLFPYVFAMLTCGAVFGVVFTFYQPFVIAQGAEHVSVFFVGFTLAAVATRVGLGGLADRVGRRRVALLALSAYSAMVLAMTQLTPDRLLVLGFGFGLAHGFFFPALNAYTVELAAASERGRAMTLVNGAFHLGNTLSILSCGWVAEHYGYVPAFVLAAAIAATGVCALHWDHAVRDWLQTGDIPRVAKEALSQPRG
jgi:MFS family permease